VKIANVEVALFDSKIQLKTLHSGTKYYLAPELLEENDNATYLAKSDVYRFGMWHH
jgi:serine/threonine protein kinase